MPVKDMSPFVGISCPSTFVILRFLCKLSISVSLSITLPTAGVGAVYIPSPPDDPASLANPVSFVAIGASLISGVFIG